MLFIGETWALSSHFWKARLLQIAQVSEGGNTSASGLVPWHMYAVFGFSGVLAQARNLLGLARDVHCLLPQQSGALLNCGCRGRKDSRPCLQRPLELA